ncbi:unnamed protein product, partial [Prorocentrum cordatum]
AVRRYKVDIFMGGRDGHLGDYEAPRIGSQGFPEPTNANGERIIAFAAAAGMEDHIPVLASLHWTANGFNKSAGPRPDMTKLKAPEAHAVFKSILKQAPTIPWAEDVNAHCEKVSKTINGAALQALGPAARAARKPYITT